MMIKLIILLFILIQFVFAQDSPKLELNNQLELVAINLLKQSSNQTFLNQILLNNKNDQQQSSYESMQNSIANNYIELTRSQIDALKIELQLHHHFIFEPIKDNCMKIEKEFQNYSKLYAQNGDIYRLEKNFLESGDKILSLQKMVIRIINSKLEQRLRKPKFNNDNIIDQFHSLCRSFFGLSITSSISDYKIFSPINQLFELTEQLKTFNVFSFNSDEKEEENNGNLKGLNRLLHRLRHTYYLYYLGRQSNRLTETTYLKPLLYQATLGLVDNVGYLMWSSNPINNMILTQFRFLVQVINGNLPINILSKNQQQQQSKQSIDPDQLKQLIQSLKQNEQNNRDYIEQTHLRTMIENVVENQQRQQTQIDKILYVLASSTMLTSTTTKITTTTTTEKPSHQHHHVTSTSNIRGGDTLRQLKQQRKLLNELLQELQKPLNQSESTNLSSSVITPNQQQQKNIQKELGQAQNQLMTIMQQITPLINVMGQSQTSIPQKKIKKSKLDLLNIIQTINNNQQILLDSSSSMIDFKQSFKIINELAIRLQTIIQTFIDHFQ